MSHFKRYILVGAKPGENVTQRAIGTAREIFTKITMHLPSKT